MGQTAILFRARRSALRNARLAGRGAFRPVVIMTVVVVCAVIVGLGHLSAESLLEIPSASSTPNVGGRAPVPGDAALEAAFWINALVCAFFSFRVMESLFRAANVRAIELLPVAPRAILTERVVNATIEAASLAVFAALFFVPLAWHGALQTAAICAALGFGATLCTAAVTIGTNTWLGAQYGDATGLGDAYGGQGGAFIYAPVVSFALSIFSLLLLQLGMREFLHEGHATNAFWLAVGIAAGLAGYALVAGARQFVSEYHRVAAFFREADEVGFRAVIDYQESAWRPSRFELPFGPVALVRRHTLQFGRRFPVGRTATNLGAVGAAIACYALSADAFPSWIAALVPAVLLAVLSRPFSRLDDADLGGASDAFLPLSTAELEQARNLWLQAESLRVGLPYAVVAATARGLTEGWASALVVASAALVVLVPGAAVSLTRMVGLRSPGAANLVAVGSVVAWGGALAASPVVAALSALSIVIVAGLWTMRAPTRAVEVAA